MKTLREKIIAARKLAAGARLYILKIGTAFGALQPGQLGTVKWDIDADGRKHGWFTCLPDDNRQLAVDPHEVGRFRIVPKRDFGNAPYLINGRWVSSGYVVTYRGCNVMPGATWSEDIRGALQMIRVAIHVGLKETGEPVDSYRFWRILHRVNGATQRNRDMTKSILQSLSK